MTKKNIESKDITTYLSPTLTREVFSLKIDLPEDLTRATELLSQLNQTLNSLTEEKEKVTKPLLEALKQERSRFKPYEDALTSAITSIRSKMSDYQTQLTRAQALEDAKIAEQVSEGKLDIGTAILRTEGRADTTAPITTSSGSLTFRAKQQLKINKLSAIPRKYLVPDEALILSTLKEGKEVAGCTLEEIQIPINSR